MVTPPKSAGPMPEDGRPRPLELRGVAISEDSNGHICLDDIWRLSRAGGSKAPKHWRRTGPATSLIAELQKKVTTSYLKEKITGKTVIYANRGRGRSGTYAHPILAAAYAGYLSPKLEIEVREIWLRYRSGDATLADEILQKASEEGNRWAGVRALSRAQRKQYTDTLKTHGVEGKGYMECTEAVYVGLLGGRSFQLRDQMDLPRKANLRDALPTDKLSYVMAAEAISAERIEDEARFGNDECIEASRIGGSVIRAAIEHDRKTRQRRLLP